MPDTPDTSRRLVLGGGLATGLAAALVTPARADEAAGAPVASNPNITTEYPRPPFQEQSQPWPGLASKMTPVPDHGEASYRGSGRLAGRKALVTGGDSGIGRAAVVAFARGGGECRLQLPAGGGIGHERHAVGWALAFRPLSLTRAGQLSVRLARF